MNTQIKSIICQDLSKTFGDFKAVDAISFEVNQGEIFGFLGANGAGKTTAMRILCGLSKPTSGQARVADFDVYTQQESIKKNIGYMSQKFSLYENLTISQNIDFFAGIYQVDQKTIKIRKQELLQQLELENSKTILVKDLALGYKQKLAFLMAIFHRPKIVFLDEPTAGVDPVTRRQFWELIHQAATSGITIFVTTHYMDEAEYCDRISIMVDGKIAAYNTVENLKKTYDCPSIEDVFYLLAKRATRT